MLPIIKILLPTCVKNSKETFYKGQIDLTDDLCITIFITSYSTSIKMFESKHLFGENTIYGYRGKNNQSKNILMKYINHIILEGHEILKIKSLVINNKKYSSNEKCIIMLYEHNQMRDSETIGHREDCFSKLQTLIKEDNIRRVNTRYNEHEPAFQSPQWLVASMFVQHVYNYINLLSWLLNIVRKKEKVTIKQGNLILAVLVDIIIGYAILEVLIFDKKDLGAFLLGVLEKLVNLMYSLLKWLMGSPAGLKLNNGFNKMLGKYFLYHVELWWLFLDVSGEKLDVVLNIYQYFGYLGLTFQAAIISDMICLATFHSYCIYVYAARLFNIQISGLTALLRLFVGRKYNPLRGGIDSCEYTNQELFVGTVAFTILLLLLPTTLMYYIVFTTFRVLSLMVQYILAKLIYFIQTLPIYVVALWLSRSSKIAGNILIEELKNDDSLLILKVKLFSKSLQELMLNFRPPVKAPKHVEWTNVISNVFTGKQII